MNPNLNVINRRSSKTIRAPLMITIATLIIGIIHQVKGSSYGKDKCNNDEFTWSERCAGMSCTEDSQCFFNFCKDSICTVQAEGFWLAYVVVSIILLVMLILGLLIALLVNFMGNG